MRDVCAAASDNVRRTTRKWSSSFAVPAPAARARLDDLLAAGVLTGSQRDVLLWRAQGFSYQAIAYGLGVTSSTVRDRELRAEQKIEIHRAAQASGGEIA